MIIKPTTNGTWIHFCRCFLGKLKAQHFSSPSSRLVENNTSGSGGLSSSFTSGCLEKYLLSIIPCRKKIFTFHLTQTNLVLMYWCRDGTLSMSMSSPVVYSLYTLIPGCESSVGVCSLLLTLFSMLLIVATLPLSLMFTVKVAQVTSDHTSCVATRGCLVSFINFRMRFVLDICICSCTERRTLIVLL